VNQNDDKITADRVARLDASARRCPLDIGEANRSAGDDHPDRQSLADLIGRHIRPPAGVFDVCRMAAGFPTAPDPSPSTSSRQLAQNFGFAGWRGTAG
jgi:hypothetical protein